VTGSSMLSPAQSPGPTSIFTLGLGERAGGWRLQSATFHSCQRRVRLTKEPHDARRWKCDSARKWLALKLVQVLYLRTRTIDILIEPEFNPAMLSRVDRS
jgi:hypothetical protein